MPRTPFDFRTYNLNKGFAAEFATIGGHKHSVAMKLKPQTRLRLFMLLLIVGVGIIAHSVYQQVMGESVKWMELTPIFICVGVFIREIRRQTPLG